MAVWPPKAIVIADGVLASRVRSPIHRGGSASLDLEINSAAQGVV
jgi:hypothetical protein